MCGTEWPLHVAGCWPRPQSPASMPRITAASVHQPGGPYLKPSPAPHLGDRASALHRPPLLDIPALTLQIILSQSPVLGCKVLALGRSANEGTRIPLPPCPRGLRALVTDFPACSKAFHEDPQAHLTICSWKRRNPVRNRGLKQNSKFGVGVLMWWEELQNYLLSGQWASNSWLRQEGGGGGSLDMLAGDNSQVHCPQIVYTEAIRTSVGSGSNLMGGPRGTP